VANAIPLGCPLLLPVHTVNRVQILKAEGGFQCLDSEAKCGNGVVDETTGEECECADKSTSCDHCEGCRFAEGKECTRDAYDQTRVQCCSTDGMYKEYKSGCIDPDSGQAGWCAQDACQVHECEYDWADLDRTCDAAHTALYNEGCRTMLGFEQDIPRAYWMIGCLLGLKPGHT
jgi:hypothetical protein